MAEPKYRTVRIPKPRSRGIRGKMALQRWRQSGGRQKQILNPETGKYVRVLFGEAGKRQLQKFYPTKERGESIKKVGEAKAAQAKRQKAGAAEAKKKAAELAAKPKPKFKKDSRILDSFKATPLGKSGDGKVTFDDQTGKYVLDAFGAKKSYTADELKKEIAKSKEPKFKEDSKLVDSFNKTPLAKSGDGKVTFDTKTGKYVLDAFGAKKSYTADELQKEIAKSKEPKFKEDSKLVDAFNKTPLGKSGDGKITFDPNTGKYTLDAFGAKKSYTADELNKEIKAAKPPKADPMPQLPPQPTPPAPTAADTKAQLDSIAEKRRAERGARSEPTPPPAPVAKDNKFKELLDEIDAGGGKLADLPTPPSRPTAPQPVTEIKADSPPPTTGRLTRGPGPEAPPPPPRIRITEEVPKPPTPAADLSELPIRDQKELNTVLKDLKNRVISPDFRTPTQDEIAEAVTKATGGRFTPPTPKVAEPPPPKAEPVVPAPTGDMPRSDLMKLETGGRGGINPGMGVFRPDGTEYRLMDPDYQDYKAGQVGLPTPAEPRMEMRTGDFQDANNNRIDDRDEPALAPTPAPAPAPAPTPPAVPAPPSLLTPDELQRKAQELREAAAALTAGDPNMTIEKVQQLTKELEGASTRLRTDTETRAGKTSDEILADAKAIVAGTGTSPAPVDSGGTFMPMPGQPPPRDAPPREAPPVAPPPPTFVNMDPLQGVREAYVPTNILGPSYDPNVREDYVQKMMQAGANIQQGGYPTFQMPTSAVPQVQFGGYGAPVPMAPLAPYAGLGAPPQPYSGAIVNPGTGEPEPIGAAPIPGMVTNLPPGVTGPIR